MLISPSQLSRIKLLQLLLWCCLSLSACGGGGGGGGESNDTNQGGDPQSGPYNILLVVADDLAYDHYGFAGHPVLSTPSLDALASQSVRFTASYGSSVCRPSFATLLTGLAEHRHGVTYISGPRLGEFASIADRLNNAGYSTYQAGKFWEGKPDLWGFNDYVRYDATNGNFAIGRETIDPVLDFTAQGSSPWFLWFSPKMPHSPHDAPDEYVAMYEGRGLDAATVQFFAMITWFDDVVGDLLQGLAEDTVVIYLADNGYIQSERPEFQAENSKGTSYEYGIRTQLLIRHPEHAATVREDLSQAEDVVATILNIANAELSGLPGRDLLAPAPAESIAYGSRWSLGRKEEIGILKERWIRMGEWKLVDVEAGEDRLYNLTLHPREEMNLIDSPEHVSQQNALQIRLEDAWVK